ncbi:YpoC family protein [Niallia sp. NCCP-28]|uniref:YpoC family protein n=1 Tax=Niallia sp. NCCP-28 TaxID=2934712 RepID=UPI00207FD050|nr:hypothetical protein [Niallia sp. NCCP-28]GKU80975.1 hypothetical protein NCCP28_03710 [Niallia sp. NCCP-28]
MEKSYCIHLPADLQIPQLTHLTEFNLDDMRLIESFQANLPFIHEGAYTKGLNGFIPWKKEHIKSSVSILIDQWKLLKVEIAQYIAAQKKEQIYKGMAHGICCFLECLYWLNDLPVTFKEGLISRNIKIMPINVEERLYFILSRVTGYHSFKQLEELFKELEKQFAIYLIKNKG